MSRYFPVLRPDELLYSGCARFRSRLDFQSHKWAMDAAFGRASGTAIVDLPNNLEAFEKTAHGRSDLRADKLVEEHSLFPIYAPFLPPERADSIRVLMKGSGGRSVHLRIGIMAGATVYPARMRFCPECDADSIAEYGHTFWNRRHQIAGVEVCEKHGLFLVDSSAKRRNRVRRHEFVDSDQTVKSTAVRRVDPANPDHRTLLRVAAGAAWLLDHPCAHRSFELSTRYSSLLAQRGLATITGRVRLSELRSAVARRYNSPLFAGFNCDSGGRWAAELLRRAPIAHSPVHHLLFMDFLNLTAEEFFTSAPIQSFEPAPYPCLNSLCEDYGLPVIESVSVAHDRQYRTAVGTFSCRSCGRIYGRLAPDAGQSRFEPTLIRSYGFLWERTLRNGWFDRSRSLRSIARQLGVDSITVKRHAEKQKLPFPRFGPRTSRKGQAGYRSRRPRRHGAGMRASRRASWLDLRGRNRCAGRTRLRTLSPATYAWLYRNDREWLTRNCPPALRRVQHCHVNWEARDFEISRKLARAAASLRRRDSPKTRVSITALERDLQITPLLTKHLGKLPLTAQRISRVVESRRDFAIRRIRIAEARFTDAGSTPSKSLFLRAAGIRPDLMIDAEISVLVNECLCRLSSLKPLDRNPNCNAAQL